MKERVLRREHDTSEHFNKKKKSEWCEDIKIHLNEVYPIKFEKLTGRENKIEYAISQ